MGVVKDIHKTLIVTGYDSSIYVIFYNLGSVSHVVNPIASVSLYYERFPFIRFDSTCFRYDTEYFAETYGPDSKHRGEYQYVDRSVCEYYPVVIDRRDGVSSFYCRQYMLYYKIYNTIIPALIYHKGYENYLPILARMTSAARQSYIFRGFYRKNLFKFGTECDIVGKVVEDYVDCINSEKEKYMSDISRYIKRGRKLTNNFHSSLEKLKTSDIVVDGKLVLRNIKEGARLFDELAKEIAVRGYSYMADYYTDLLELAKIIRTLGTSHGTAYGV